MQPGLARDRQAVPLTIFAGFVTLMIIYKHRANLARLRPAPSYVSGNVGQRE